jgi:hypothetical protein
MSRRDIIAGEYCIAVSVAVLIAVAASPIRPLRSSGRQTPQTFLLRNFALSSSGKARLASHLPPTPGVRTDAVLGEPGEDEKEATHTSWPSPGFLTLPREHALPRALEVSSTATVPATHPLRC